MLPVWLSGNVLVSINVVTLRQSRLVPGWGTDSYGKRQHIKGVFAVMC